MIIWSWFPCSFFLLDPKARLSGEPLKQAKNPDLPKRLGQYLDKTKIEQDLVFQLWEQRCNPYGPVVF